MKQVIRKMILESIASDLVNAGFKTWKYTDENGESFFPKGRSAKEAALYLKLKYKLQNIDVSRIEPHSGLGYADNTTIDIYNQRYQPTDENKKSNKMKVNVLKQIIREEIASVMNESSDSSEFVAAVAALKNLSMIERSDFKRFIEWFEKAKEYNPSGIGKMSAQELVAAKNSADRDKELDNQYDF